MKMPLADAHLHVMTWMKVPELLERMDRNAIRWAGGVGVGGVREPGAGQAQFSDAVAVLGSRYIRPTGTGPWLSLRQALGPTAYDDAETPAARQRLASIEVDLRDHGARVVGEIHVNALTSSPEPVVRFKSRADSPMLRAIFGLATRYGRPLNIHAQWDPDTAREVEQLAASNRAGRLMISHCGSFADAAEIRALFERNANVVCDLSARSVPPMHDRDAAHAVFDERGIRGQWKALIEDYPDRFVVGSDIPQDWDEYERIVRVIRSGLLANLSPATAERVAFGNAQAWFGLR